MTAEHLGAAAGLRASIGARLAIEAIFDALDPTSRGCRGRRRDPFRPNVEPSAVLISPRREFKTRPSNSLPDWPRRDRRACRCAQTQRDRGAASAPARLHSSPNSTAIRRPATATSSSFGVASNVHAADDLSVMETLSVYPSVIASARTLCPEKPIWLGPCTIGMRHNPYGAAVADNPEGTPQSGESQRPSPWRNFRSYVRGRCRGRSGQCRCRSPHPGRSDRPLRTAGRRSPPTPDQASPRTARAGRGCNAGRCCRRSFGSFGFWLLRRGRALRCDRKCLL